MNGGSARFRSFGRANSWGSRIWLRHKVRAEGEEPLAGEKNIRPQPVCNPAVCNPKRNTDTNTEQGECYGNPTHQRRDSRARSGFTERMDCVPEGVAQKRKGVHQIKRRIEPATPRTAMGES